MTIERESVLNKIRALLAKTMENGCSEAEAERFEASAGRQHAAAPRREGYMTIIVYGHSEHVV